MLPFAAFSKNRVLHEGVPRRAYGTAGDALLQQRVAQALIEWSLPAEARDFNLDVLDGESTSLTDLLACCGNLPFLAEHRVVVVSRAERLENLHRASVGEANAAKEKNSKSPGAARRLSDGLKNLPPGTVLVLQRTPETPESGSRGATRGAVRCINAAVDKVLEGEAGGLIINCTIDANDGNTPVTVLVREAQERGIPLARDAASHLVERCGHDLVLLLSELEKCALRAGAGQVVTAALIDEMTRRKPQDTIFDLTDALGARRSAHAVGLLRELVQSGEAPEMILTMLARHFRQLLQARFLLDAGLPLDASTHSRLPAAFAGFLPTDNLAAWLQANGRHGRRLAQQASNFTTAQLVAALEGVQSSDLAMKGIENDGGAESRQLPELMLELLITRLA